MISNLDLEELLTETQMTWAEAKLIMASGGYVRRAIWLWTCQHKNNVKEVGHGSITARAFETIQGELTYCIVVASSSSSPMFPYCVTQDCENAIDWIEIKNKNLR